ncbi:MAG: hypothetical protein OXB91_09505 [Bryobacterales bacterium]|nr:hypothetical protein [Bryobacterales bacterium]
MTLEWIHLLASFGGGLFGAAIGTLPSFVFTGLLVIAGAAVAAAGGGTDVLAHIAFGPVFGPHIAFGGGAAATAYAYRRGLIESGRDISLPLMGLGRVDVLLIGGAFGSAGYLLESLWRLAGLGPRTDTIAMTVVISAMIARLLFGRSGLASRQFRPDERRNWVRHQERPSQCAVIGLGVGLLSAFIAVTLGPERGGDVLGFGIAAASLVFAQFGLKVPVTHHMALPAAAATLASGSFLAGPAFGIVGAFAGEGFSRVFHQHGDTHVDPPAAGIAMTIVLVRLLWPLPIP